MRVSAAVFIMLIFFVSFRYSQALDRPPTWRDKLKPPTATYHSGALTFGENMVDMVLFGLIIAMVARSSFKVDKS